MVEIDKIKQLIKENGTSATHICKALGLNTGYLRDVAAGKTALSEDRLEKIADILGTTTAYLHGETDIKNKPTEIGELSKDEVEFLKGFHSLPEDLQNQLRKTLEIYVEASQHHKD